MLQLLTASQIEVFLACNVAVCLTTLAIGKISQVRRLSRILTGG
jgi:hypothetical protein